MPLRDHFHEPLRGRLRFSTLHSGWATYLATNLIEKWLPPPYLAVEHANQGKVEIDIATYDTGETHRPSGNGGGVATLPRTWTVPPALCTVPLRFPDRFEVQVFADSSGWELVGAIELVSEGNKDRPVERTALVNKCASYLHEGVSVVIIDVVTNYHFNLHNQLLDRLGVSEGRLEDGCHLYASAYRPVSRGGQTSLDIWAAPCAIGERLPDMPLRLKGDLVVPVEFELTYTEICTKRRLI